MSNDTVVDEQYVDLSMLILSNIEVFLLDLAFVISTVCVSISRLRPYEFTNRHDIWSQRICIVVIKNVWVERFKNLSSFSIFWPFCGSFYLHLRSNASSTNRHAVWNKRTWQSDVRVRICYSPPVSKWRPFRSSFTQLRP